MELNTEPSTRTSRHATAAVAERATAVSVSVRPHVTDAGSNPALRGSAATMPLEGPLVDRYDRVHEDLRISATDRCNLRCVYCMAEECMTFLPRAQLLTFDEIVRVARVARQLGITSVRLTGGEPQSARASGSTGWTGL
jgi:uncharacterized radical SAM superfamily Fe-S cluster-containing enzyme